MVKNSKETIVKDEIKVLNALGQHSKASVNDIAKSCGFSRQKVWRIIKDLEKRQIIWGYTGISDENARNLKHFILMVKRNTVPFDESYKKELILDKLDNYSPNLIVEDISLIHGEYDGIVTFYAPDILSAKKLVEEIFKRIGKYFDRYTLFETMFTIRKQGIKNPRIKEIIKYF
jgi:DNA-binding Lrp family transcriptional regulator